jgi:hypothetical protein
MGTGSFPAVKRPGRGLNHPPHLAPRLKKEYSYTSSPLRGFVTCYKVNFTFILHNLSGFEKVSVVLPDDGLLRAETCCSNSANKVM